jgi:hypothetical protein
MIPETIEETTDGGLPCTPCSRSLRARLREVIQKFRDEEEYLLLDKSSRALGGAIAYGDMATALSKLIEKPDKPEDMMTMLCRIGYPQRGTSDEVATIENFAAEIQAKWSLDELIPGGWEIFDENSSITGATASGASKSSNRPAP